MPAKQCQRDNQSGWKWGDEGYCYIGSGAKSKAEKQGAAIEVSKVEKMTRKIETVVVSKASIDMGNAQSIDQFSQNMREAGKNFHTEAEWLWIEEITPTTVIFCAENDDYEMKYWQHNWSISNGLPQLQTGPIEMQRVSTFVPKPVG